MRHAMPAPTARRRSNSDPRSSGPPGTTLPHANASGGAAPCARWVGEGVGGACVCVCVCLCAGEGGGGYSAAGWRGWRAVRAAGEGAGEGLGGVPGHPLQSFLPCLDFLPPCPSCPPAPAQRPPWRWHPRTPRRCSPSPPQQTGPGGAVGPAPRTWSACGATAGLWGYTEGLHDIPIKVHRSRGCGCAISVRSERRGVARSSEAVCCWKPPPSPPAPHTPHTRTLPCAASALPVALKRRLVLLAHGGKALVTRVVVVVRHTLAICNTHAHTRGWAWGWGGGRGDATDGAPGWAPRCCCPVKCHAVPCCPCCAAAPAAAGCRACTPLQPPPPPPCSAPPSLPRARAPMVSTCTHRRPSVLCCALPTPRARTYGLDVHAPQARAPRLGLGDAHVARDAASTCRIVDSDQTLPAGLIGGSMGCVCTVGRGQRARGARRAVRRVRCAACAGTAAAVPAHHCCTASGTSVGMPSRFCSTCARGADEAACGVWLGDGGAPVRAGSGSHLAVIAVEIDV
jgi:hypothetical protein